MSDKKKELPTVADANPERCETCRFWDDSDGNEGGGWCRRYPPTVILTSSGFTQHSPMTPDQMWCGEWRAKMMTVLPADAKRDSGWKWPMFMERLSLRLRSYLGKKKIYSFSDLDERAGSIHPTTRAINELTAKLFLAGIPKPVGLACQITEGLLDDYRKEWENFPAPMNPTE